MSQQYYESYISIILSCEDDDESEHCVLAREKKAAADEAAEKKAPADEAQNKKEDADPNPVDEDGTPLQEKERRMKLFNKKNLGNLLAAGLSLGAKRGKMVFENWKAVFEKIKNHMRMLAKIGDMDALVDTV